MEKIAQVVLSKTLDSTFKAAIMTDTETVKVFYDKRLDYLMAFVDDYIQEWHERSI